MPLLIWLTGFGLILYGMWISNTPLLIIGGFALFIVPYTTHKYRTRHKRPISDLRWIYSEEKL